ncbi:hypothetical protein [Vitiosangium sp. GDMCC 1.1324]|uniref:hypothetical protein n=1 Tax=Vitiosangium sp. (strain GDMCC 1.1324) TaxID=2138576 RepID=UPI0011B50EB0|nr:hypothetical protein [Vitiosangium sp. GDMCC 1.1324]
MAPEGFADFFLASAGTGGAFVGLLFVAISIGPHRTFGELDLAVGPQQHLAEATLLTLVNGFVISSIALIPDVNVGWFALVMGVVGVIVSTRLVRLFARIHRHGPEPYAPWRHFLRVGSQSMVASMVFATEAVLGLLLILHPADRDTFRWLGVTIIVLYTSALFRAWTLLGNPRYGLSGWLNPLQDQTVQRDKDEPSR